MWSYWGTPLPPAGDDALREEPRVGDDALPDENYVCNLSDGNEASTTETETWMFGLRRAWFSSSERRTRQHAREDEAVQNESVAAGGRI